MREEEILPVDQDADEQRQKQRQHQRHFDDRRRPLVAGQTQNLANDRRAAGDVLGGYGPVMRPT